MQVSHIVPPGWAGIFPKGSYRMVLAHWVLGYPGYAATMKGSPRALAPDSPFILLDNGVFEGEQVTLDQLNEAARRVCADEVVLPDVQGDPKATLHRSWTALGKIATNRLVFVPQGATHEEWAKCLQAWISRWEHSDWADVYTLTIGISSLRNPEDRKAIQGTRPQQMIEAAKTAYPVHLLGIASPRVFGEEELPVALSCGVRGVDSSTAFALGASGKLLTMKQPKEFLRVPGSYDLLPTNSKRLIYLNRAILEHWVAEGEGSEVVPTHIVRSTAQRWLKYYQEGFCPLEDVLKAVGLKGKFALTRGSRKGRNATRREKHLRPLEDNEKPLDHEEVINV